jgi:hypothetical protein
MPRLVLEFNRDDLSAMQYPVVVEMWDKVVGRDNAGSKQRKYHAEFTEQERAIISKYYLMFYRWYLVKGTPEKYTWPSLQELQLVQRAVNFFGTL